MKTFCLITNVSGCKYWSQRIDNIFDAELVGMVYQFEKYGTIYVNDCGGWFHEDAVKTLHETVEADRFPNELDIEEEFV